MLETQNISADMLSIHRIETTFLFPENTSSDEFRKQKQFFLSEIKKLPLEGQKLFSNILKQKNLNIQILGSGTQYDILKLDKSVISSYEPGDDINNLLKSLKEFLFKTELSDTQNQLADLMGNISTPFNNYATSGLDINSFQKNSTLFNAFFNRIKVLKNSNIGVEGLFDTQADTKKFFDDLDNEIGGNKVDRTILPLALSKAELVKNENIDKSIKSAVNQRLEQTGKDKAILFRCNAQAGTIWIFLTLDN